LRIIRDLDTSRKPKKPVKDWQILLIAGIAILVIVVGSIYISAKGG
jgi:hypothetical protein